MTPNQQEPIRSSWAQVAPIADTAAQLFYERLFELDPTRPRGVRRTDMAAERKNLMQTLSAVVVAGIDRLDTLIPAVEALGPAACRLRREGEPLRDRRPGAPRHAPHWARRRVHSRTSPRRGARRTSCSPA